MEQMTRMNSRVDEIQDFVKTNVQPTMDKKGKYIRITLSTKAKMKNKKHQLSSSKIVIWRTRKNRLRLNLIMKNTSPLCLILKP